MKGKEYWLINDDQNDNLMMIQDDGLIEDNNPVDGFFNFRNGYALVIWDKVFKNGPKNLLKVLLHEFYLVNT